MCGEKQQLTTARKIAHIILAAASASAAAAAAVGAVLKLAHREHGRVGEHGQLGGLGCVVEERAGAERVVVERPVKIAKFVALQIVLQLTLPHGRGFDQVACGGACTHESAALVCDNACERARLERELCDHQQGRRDEGNCAKRCGEKSKVGIVRARARACVGFVRACVRACVRARACACVRARVRV
eukprot:2878522-Pleurochrysis_carterae.AAC.2